MFIGMTVSRRFFPCRPFFLDIFLDRRYTQFIKLYNNCKKVVYYNKMRVIT